MPLALYVKAELGLDYAFANQVKIMCLFCWSILTHAKTASMQLKVSWDGKTLTGETVGPIVDGIRKAELLDVLAQAEGVTPKQVIAVGDGANDLWMLNKAGLGIAFNAKPRVQQQVKRMKEHNDQGLWMLIDVSSSSSLQAPSRINQKSLKYVLTLLGFSEQDLEQLSSDY